MSQEGSAAARLMTAMMLLSVVIGATAWRRCSGKLARDTKAKRVRDQQAAAEKRENDLKLTAAESERKAEQAKREKLESEQKAERDRLAAIKSQAEAVERAKQAEITPQADVKAEEKRQSDAREADKAHKGAVYKAAKEAFIANGMSEECARLAVKVIASGFIPAISITY